MQPSTSLEIEAEHSRSFGQATGKEDKTLFRIRRFKEREKDKDEAIQQKMSCFLLKPPPNLRQMEKKKVLNCFRRLG